MSNVKILILKPRNHLYSRRLNGYSNLLLANIHRQLFTGKFDIDVRDLPWWLQPEAKPITDPARLLEAPTP